MENGIDSSLQVESTSYLNQPAMPGDSATFQCRSSAVLHGPNSSNCTDDGYWEPDPQNLQCVVSTTVINGNSSNRTDDGFWECDPKDLECVVNRTLINGNNRFMLVVHI